MKGRKNYSLPFLVIFILMLCPVSAIIAQEDFLYGDPLPDAPELSARGEHTIGVRTLKFVHKDQIDILNSEGGEDPLYDRPLTVEVWYPAEVVSNTNISVTYKEVM